MSKKDKIENEQPEEILDTAEAEEEALEGEITEAPAEPSHEELLNAEKERYLRLAVEYDNFRKRSQKEREALFQSVRADTILQLLPVYDNLERALNTPTSDDAFRKGIEMTMNQLLEVFEKMGVKAIEATGQKFDANLHNAVMHVDDDEHSEGEIVEEFQKGFTLGDKVIRFSMVKVAN